MKLIRIGNDIQINWVITRFGEPEDFSDKTLSVALYDKYNNKQKFEYTIEDNKISGCFYGKDQTTNGVYRLFLVENEGEENMVSLDFIDCFCISYKLKNQTSNGEDPSNINTEVVEVTSDINTNMDLSDYATIEYVDEKDSDIYTYYNTKFTTVNNQIESLGCNLVVLTDDVSNLHTTTYNLEGAVSYLDESNAYLRDKYSYLTDDVAYIKHDVAYLSCDVATLQDNVTHLSCDMIMADCNIAYINMGLTYALNSVTYLDNRVNAVETKLPSYTSQLINDSRFVSGNQISTIVVLTQSQFDQLSYYDINTEYNII